MSLALFPHTDVHTEAELVTFLLGSPSLTTLKLLCPALTDHSPLKLIHRLQSLEVKINRTALSNICSTVASIPTLRTLTISALWGHEWPPNLIESFTNLARSPVTHLNISGTVVTEAAMALLSTSNVTHLEIDGLTTIRGMCFENFILPNNLQVLKIDTHQGAHMGAFEDWSAEARGLRSHLSSIDVKSTLFRYGTYFSPSALTHICALTNMTSLKMTLVGLSNAELSHWNRLINLTALDLTLYEDLTEITEGKSDCWLSTLPRSLSSLTLKFEYKHLFSKAVYSTYRTFAQCLPHLSHLSSLRFLSLGLGGVLTSESLQAINYLPSLSILNVSLSPYAEQSGIEEKQQLIDTLVKFKSLRHITVDSPLHELSAVRVSPEFKALLIKSLERRVTVKFINC